MGNRKRELAGVSLVVLAAGMGSRYGGLKQMEPVGPNGELLIEYSIFDALSVGIQRIVFVIQEAQEDPLRELLGKKLKGRCEMTFVHQKVTDVPEGVAFSAKRRKPWGTGHAVLSCRDAVQGTFIVINADDFYGAHPFHEIRRFLSNVGTGTPPEYALVGRRIEDMLSPHGFVSRGICHVGKDGRLERITEEEQIGFRNGVMRSVWEGKTREISLNTIASMSMWVLYPSVFNFLGDRFRAFLDANASSNEEREFPITCIAQPEGEGHDVRLIVSTGHWFGLTHAVDLDDTRTEIRKLISLNQYPEVLWTR